MKNIHKIILRYVFDLLLLGGLIFIPFKTMSSANPYDQKGFDFKQKRDFDLKPEGKQLVELEADQVQFSQETNKAMASGNVVVTSGKTILYAEQASLQKSIGEAVASGHVYIDAPLMQVDADSVKYNFNDSTGEFQNARLFYAPMQIKGKSISKVSDNHMILNNGFMTTCDHDDPHFRVGAKKMDIYPGDKAVIRGMKVYIGKVPMMYWPKYTQDLKNDPIFVVTPGYKKDFGAFLLTELRLKLSDRVKVKVHGDIRERTGFGEGVDVKYETPNFGAGILRTYYAAENKIASNHPWNQRNSEGEKKAPTTHHELYRVEWRHKWQIDQRTSAVWQYYKVHDYDLANMGFLKRYFEREYRQGADVATYFLLTKNLPKGVVTFRIDASRVNRPLRGVERLPEIQYVLSGEKLGDTNFYLKTTDTFSNLTNKQPDNHMKTLRVDSDNEVSYPKKIGFIELRPFVGGKHTYYSRTKDLNERSVVRGQFRTGSDLTTHFYRVWNYNKKVWGVEMNGIRHVITPSASYIYAHRPTIDASRFNQFDYIDEAAYAHKVHVSLENKIQTKRNKQSVDLLRTILESDYELNPKEPGRGFGPYKSTIEFNPNSWLSLRTEQSYDHKLDHWNYADFDIYINNGDKWKFGIGKRYARDLNDQVTTELTYKINPKWKFKVYERYYIDQGTLKEEDYILTRDLHEWEMDLNYHQERGRGIAFLVGFRLKAFPDSGLSLFSSSFHEPKAGSQSQSQQ